VMHDFKNIFPPMKLMRAMGKKHELRLKRTLISILKCNNQSAAIKAVVISFQSHRGNEKICLCSLNVDVDVLLVAPWGAFFNDIPFSYDF
jgi:hypothetical protein